MHTPLTSCGRIFNQVIHILLMVTLVLTGLPLSSANAASADQDFTPHLYKLTRHGKTSYVFGTIHMGVSVSELPPVVVERLNQVDVMLGEQMLEAYQSSLLMRENFRQSFLKAKETNCRKKLDPLQAESQVILKLLDIGVPGDLAGCAGRIIKNPLVIAFAPYIFRNPPQGAMDADIAVHLASRNIPVAALETEAELKHARQIEQERKAAVDRLRVKLPAFPREKEISSAPSQSPSQLQVQLQVQDIDRLVMDARKQVEFYRSGVTDIKYDFDGSNHDLLLRNRAWARKIMQSFSQKKFGVVVGYRHLYGRSGLLELLRRQGYTVTRVADNAPYQSNDEFAHISATQADIQNAQCLKPQRMRDLNFQAYLEKAQRDFPKKASAAVGGILFKDEPAVAVYAYQLLTSERDYKLMPKRDLDFWKFLKDSGCTTTECAANKVFGNKVGSLYLAFLMRTGINLSHLGYDRMTPPIFGEEKAPSESNVQAFKALYVPKAWTPETLEPYLGALLNLPAQIFPFSNVRMLRSHFEHPRGPGVNSDAVMTFYPSMEDTDDRYKAYTAVHEIGHLVGTKFSVDGDIEWMNISWNVDRKAAKATRKDDQSFVSPYAKQNIFEDFAESFAAYRFNPEKLKRVSPEKYDYIKNKIFNGIEYTNETECPVSLGDSLSLGQ